MENQPMGQTLCLDCSGTGKKNDETPCPGCEGTGLVAVCLPPKVPGSEP
jgi:DnaJ-class molecular chaperone